MKVDYLIIGQGIAGTMLSWFLEKRGKSVAFVDEGNPNSSSRVAGGLYNPVVFRRMNKSWKADTLIPFLEKTYSEMEKEFDIYILKEEQILRIFPNKEEIKLWEKEWQAGDMDHYLSEEIIENPYPDFIQGEHGAALVKNSGAVDVPPLLAAFQKRYENQNSYVKENFEFEDLKITANGVQWKSIEAGKIIFAEGFLGVHNPYFPDVTLSRNKGEVMILEIPGFEPRHIINKKGFLAPLGNQLFKLGATYAWKDFTEEPTEGGRKLLLEKVEKILKCPYKIVEHQAGIRPAAQDRRPLIGLHPDHPQMAFFNGMGTKGVMIAPYFAQHLVEHLEDGKPLLEEVDIQRFD